LSWSRSRVFMDAVAYLTGQPAAVRTVLCSAPVTTLTGECDDDVIGNKVAEGCWHGADDWQNPNSESWEGTKLSHLTLYEFFVGQG